MSAVPSQAQVALDTVLQTAEAAAPTIAAVGVGVAAAANPNVALALQLSEAALPMLNQAQALVKAGNATPAQLEAMWASVSSMVLSAHAALRCDPAPAQAAPAQAVPAVVAPAVTDSAPAPSSEPAPAPAQTGSTS
jgi:hypothetical protein